MVSNTIFYDYEKATNFITRYVTQNKDFCSLTSIGKSLKQKPLHVINYSKTSDPKGRIFITTGCHPAELDLAISLAIMKFLTTPLGQKILENYNIDIMPMQNPGGFLMESCLTANGINLYWNFRHTDKFNCPEAFYLQQYLKKIPPLLCLDFHFYVTQFHRPSMPYLKPRHEYWGLKTKRVVHHINKTLTKLSNGFYKTGSLSSWPASLSYLITAEFNTIAYTKYHFNLKEGLKTSQNRAEEIFIALTNQLIKRNLSNSNTLKNPYRGTQSDSSNKAPIRIIYKLEALYKQLYIYLKSYSNKYTFYLQNFLRN